MDTAEARHLMVETQVRTNDVTHPALQRALRHVPREVFVPKSRRELAYAEVEIETLPGRWMWRPRDLAKLMQALSPAAGQSALVIGCGDGYGVAVLASIVDTVVGLEASAEHVAACEKNLAAAQIDNAVIVDGDLKAGLPKQAPFDLILLGGAVELVPEALLAQLSDGGRLAAVIRKGNVGRGTVFTRSGSTFAAREVFDSGVPVLAGFVREQTFQF